MSEEKNMLNDHSLKQPAVVLAEQYFLDAVRSGKYAAGASIKESVLAREFDLPRTAIREMLNQALQWDLVVYNAYRGFRIREFTLRDAWEWCTLREGVEPVAARLLAQQCSTETLEKLHEIHRKMLACPEPMSQEAWNWDIEFHASTVRYCGNHSIAGLYSRIYCSAPFYYQVTSQYNEPLLQFEPIPEALETARERSLSATRFWHEKMLEAIEQRQDELAEYLFKKHLHDIRIKHELLYRQSLQNRKN